MMTSSRQIFGVAQFYQIVLAFTYYAVRSMGQGQLFDRVLPAFDMLHNESFAEYVRRIECVFCQSDSLCRHHNLEVNFMAGRQYSCYQCAECNIDKDCALYGDCCPGKEIANPRGMCSPQTLSADPTTRGGNRVIADCSPSYFNNDVMGSCKLRGDKSRNISISTPVTSITGLTFRNRFCAECNNVDSYTSWNTSVHCEKEFRLSSTFSYVEMMRQIWEHDTCTIDLIQPGQFSNFSRRCEIYDDDALISVCNVTGRWVKYDSTMEKACENYTRPFHHNNTIFRNVFCFLCNGDAYKSLKECENTIFGSEGLAGIDDWEYVEYESHPFSVLVTFSSIFNFNLDDTTTERKFTTQSCDRGLVYDPVNGTCREIYCMPGRWLSEGKCVKIIATNEWLEYFVIVVYQITKPVGENGCANQALPANLTQELFNAISNVNGSLTISEKTVQIGELWGLEYSQCIKCWDTIETECYFSKSKTLQRYIVRIGYIMTNEKDVSEIRQEFSELFTKTYELRIDDEMFIVRPDSKASHVYEWTGHIDIENLQDGEILPRKDLGGPTPYIYYKSIHFTSQMYCPHVMLRREEFSLFENRTSVTIYNTTLTLGRGLFWSQDETTGYICVDAWNNIFEGVEIHREIDLAHGILSLVCTCLSILCLIVTFIIYCVVRSMRTLPGLNNMALVLTLIIAQVLYQFGVGQTHVDRYVCEAIGITTHYFWLVAVFWMNVCCIYMFRMFGSTAQTIGHRSNSWKETYFRHAVYASSVPLIIIATNVIVSLSNSSGVTLGYIGVYCFIADKLKLGLTLALPVGCIILINTVLFVKVVTAINKQSRLSATVATDRDYIHVYIRLSTITGATWIFGFLHQMTDIKTFGYLFTVCNASQGVFIFVAFICSRTTLRHLRELNLRRANKSILSSLTGSTHV